MIKETKFWIILAIIFLPFVIYEIYNNYIQSTDKKDLLKNGRITIATITDVTNHQNRRSSIKNLVPTYTFQVNDNTYTGTGCGFIQFNCKNEIREDDIGSKFYLIFLLENPKINSILPFEKIHDKLDSINIETKSGKIIKIRPKIDSLIIPKEGWTIKEKFLQGISRSEP